MLAGLEMMQRYLKSHPGSWDNLVWRCSSLTAGATALGKPWAAGCCCMRGPSAREQWREGGVPFNVRHTATAAPPGTPNLPREKRLLLIFLLCICGSNDQQMLTIFKESPGTLRKKQDRASTDQLVIWLKFWSDSHLCRIHRIYTD